MTHHQSLFWRAPDHVDTLPLSEHEQRIANNRQQSTLDEQEIEERHGAQYHLRHHLSGCSQTLYVIDFQNDFSVAEPAVQLMPPLFSPEELESLVTTSVHVGPYVPEVYLQVDRIMAEQPLLSSVEILQTSTGNSGSEPSVSLNSVLSEMPLSMTPEPPLIAMNEVTKSTTENISNSIESHMADFEDMDLGGWSLGNSLSVEEIVDNGRLHITDDKFIVDQPLLQQKFSFAADGPYQFEMEIKTSFGIPSPNFVLTVNDIRIPLESVPSDNGYILRADFIPLSSEPVSLVVMPTSPLPAQSALWLDNVAIQPIAPNHNESLNAELAEKQDVTEESQHKLPPPLTMDALLTPRENMPTLTVTQHDESLNLTLRLEGIIGNIEVNEWNLQNSMMALPLSLPHDNPLNLSLEENSVFY